MHSNEISDHNKTIILISFSVIEIDTRLLKCLQTLKNSKIKRNTIQKFAKYYLQNVKVLRRISSVLTLFFQK